MKNYEADGKVNYDDLSGDDLGKVRGYGPVFGEFRENSSSGSSSPGWYDGVGGYGEWRKVGRENSGPRVKHCKFEGCSAWWYEGSGTLEDCQYRVSEYCCSHGGKVDEILEREREEFFGTLKFLGKTALGIGASSVLGPAGSFITGGALWGTSKIGAAASDSREAKEAWNSIGGFGWDLAQGEVVGSLVGTAAGKLASKGGGDFKKAYESAEIALTYGQPTGEILVHSTHIDNGVRYDPNCPICN